MQQKYAQKATTNNLKSNTTQSNNTVNANMSWFLPKGTLLMTLNVIAIVNEAIDILVRFTQT